MSKFHYIDDSVELDFPLSSVMKEAIEEAEEADLANDFFRYAMLSDDLDLMGKSAFTNGRITHKQWDDLCRRFPYPEIKKED